MVETPLKINIKNTILSITYFPADSCRLNGNYKGNVLLSKKTFLIQKLKNWKNRNPILSRSFNSFARFARIFWFPIQITCKITLNRDRIMFLNQLLENVFSKSWNNLGKSTFPLQSIIFRYICNENFLSWMKIILWETTKFTVNVSNV